MSQSLRAAITKRSRLKNKANKSQLPADLSKYKKQRNLVVKLNKKHKKEYFENLSVATNSKPLITVSRIFQISTQRVTLTLC